MIRQETARPAWLTLGLLPTLCLAARGYLAWVFLSAAWGKIASPYDFAVTIATYDMTPLWAVNAMALVLPWFEALVGVGLLLGVAVRVQALGMAGMLVMFCYAIGSAVLRGVQMSGCGCFASQEAVETLSWGYLWRDLGWLALVLALYAVPRRWDRASVDFLVTWLKQRRAAQTGGGSQA